MILLGARSPEPELAAIRSLLPLIAAAFARERATLALESRVALASQMAAQAHTLTEALDGARRDLQHALAGAEAAREREAFLGNVGATLDASLDYAETLQRVARIVVPTFADYCIVELLDADRSLRPVAVAHRDPAKDDLLWEYRRRYPVARVQREATAGLLERREGQLFPAITEAMLRGMAADAAHLAIMQALAPSSCVVAPLVTRGRAFGILSCVRTGGRPAYDGGGPASSRRSWRTGRRWRSRTRACIGGAGGHRGARPVPVGRGARAAHAGDEHQRLRAVAACGGTRRRRSATNSSRATSGSSPTRATGSSG